MANSVFLPAYSISDSDYRAVADICKTYGKTAVLIGGKRALNAASSLILDACKGVIEIMGVQWYGGQASFENVSMLEQDEAVKKADMIFAVGGGKAIDTCKALAETIGKPIFAFPTIASTCAATTAVAIMYHPDGTFFRPYFLASPPKHTFICQKILAEAPSEYLWAGMGDTYAKYFESGMSSRGEVLMHDHALGVTVAQMCKEPILRFGAQALRDNREGKSSDAFLQVVLAIIVTTGIASIYLTKGDIIDYNTGLAHAIFYSLTKNPVVEEQHLHGEVVAFGVLALLLVDDRPEEFQQMLAFNREIGLPIRLEEIGVDPSEIPQIALDASKMHDIDHNPYVISAQQIQKALEKLQTI